ncbi:hypothetical protein NURINAE_00732 [Candidatus Nitrosacidococcus sp. I8]|nr:hypothetical protein NURINAE_00732 [Candidatus Nitrosacidococcus sp. I8]
MVHISTNEIAHEFRVVREADLISTNATGICVSAYSTAVDLEKC